MFEAKNQETSTLKDGLKTVETELDNHKRDLKSKNKALKEKEKENYNIHQKNEILLKMLLS